MFLGVATRWGIQMTRHRRTHAEPNRPAVHGHGDQHGHRTFPGNRHGHRVPGGAGLTITGMSGNGWLCPSGGLTCLRADSLDAGASYPPVTVTANVGTVPLLTNQASISGGGALNSPSAQDVTTTSANLVTLTVNQSYTGYPVTSRMGPLAVTIGGVAYNLPAQLSVPANTPVNVSFTDLQPGPIRGPAILSAAGATRALCRITSRSPEPPP